MKSKNTILSWAALILFLLLCFSAARAEEQSEPSIGLVLSGGGARGLAHIGVLKVLEDAGVKVDYIAGTSMGALVGALYSIGYSVENIERIVSDMDWDEILTDSISRQSISIEEKEEEGRYVSSLPIRDNKISLPRGLIAGHKTAEVISRLTWSVHDVDDFSKFLIPFSCVATEITTGESVLLDHGYLPDALRASAAIPSIFSPVEVDGRLLVDGFLTRNLPASVVRDMGADIVIGVDVGAGLYDRENLDSLVRVMEQVANLKSEKTNAEERNLCDVLIIPDLDEYTTTSFWDADSLIIRGERAAHVHFKELLDLAGSQGPAARPLHAPDLTDLSEAFTITEIEIEGASNVSENLILGKLALPLPATLNFKKLELAVDRVFGSRYFENVTYRLTPVFSGVKLTVRVVEQEDDQFRVGLNYNSDMKSSLLLNTTFRNLVEEGSKLSLSAKLGQYPSYEGLFFVHTGWRPGIGFGVNPAFRKFDVRVYAPEGDLVANINFSMFTTDFYLQTIFSNSFTIGGGLQYHYASSKVEIGPPEWGDINLGQLNYFGFIKIDTLDRSVYPRNGFRFNGMYRAITDNLITEPYLGMKPFKQISLTASEYIPVYNRLTLFGTFSGGASTYQYIPEYYMFYLGGAGQFPEPYSTTLFPFLGRNFMEVGGANAIVTLVGLQYEFQRGKYLTLRANRGKIADNFEDIFSKSNLLTGAGLTAGMLSPVGPMEYTLMWESEKKELITFVNIGFIF